MTLPFEQRGDAIARRDRPGEYTSQQDTLEHRVSLSEDIGTLEMEVETLEDEKVQITADHTDVPTNPTETGAGAPQGSEEDIVLSPRSLSMAKHLQKAGFTVRTVVPQVLLTPEEREELARQRGYTNIP
jgi:hypothetical protein